MAGFDFLLAEQPAKVSGPMTPPVVMPRAPLFPVLDRADRELMNALAAMQLRYGKGDEAPALLQLSNRLWPQDEQTLRLLTQAFLLVEDYASAEMTEEAWRRLTAARRPSRTDLMRQAVIHLGRLRLAEARAALMQCFATPEREAA